MGDQITEQDPNEWLMGGGGVRSATFKQVGDQVVGFIMRTPELQQQRDFETQQPKFWPNGDKMMQLRVILMTEERDPSDPEDDGQRAIYVRANVQKAVQTALIEAKARGLEVGGKLLLKYAGDGTASKRGFTAPKLYEAMYRSPATQLPSEPAPEPVGAGKNTTPAPF